MPFTLNPLLAYRRLIHAIDNHGLAGALRQILVGKTDVPTAPGAPEPEHPFDRQHGVRTSGYVPGEQVQTSTLSGLYVTAYYGISPSTLRHALTLIPEPLRGFTFLDLGCGKGRALLVAAEQPFASILGVEIDPDLARIAGANTAAEDRVRVEQGDATTFRFPQGPLVVYLYHPFLPPVLRRVLRNLRRDRAQSPHPTYLLYANPAYQRVIARFPFLELAWHYRIPLSPEDAAVDRHGIIDEPYALYRIRRV